MVRTGNNTDQQRQDSIVYYAPGQRRMARDVARSSASPPRPRRSTPTRSPWRTTQVTARPGTRPMSWSSSARPGAASLTRLARAVFILLIGATVGGLLHRAAPQGRARRGEGSRPRARVLAQRRPLQGRQPLRRRLRERSESSVDVVDAGGDARPAARRQRHSRPAEAAAAAAGTGAPTTASACPDGRYRVRVTLRREGPLGDRAAHDAAWTPNRRGRGVRSVQPGSIVAVGTTPIHIEVGSVSRRRSPSVPRSTASTTPRRSVVASCRRSPDTRRWHWDGKVDGKPAPVGDVPRPGDRARPRGQRRRRCRGGCRRDRGESRGVPG